jgi:hypothetical protein
MLASRVLSRAAPRSSPLAATAAPPLRGARNKAKAKIELGWTELREQLENVPLRAPDLAELQVRHGTTGHGHTGARKFCANMLAKLRYQNPAADISSKAHKDWATSVVQLTLKSQPEPIELDVTKERQSDIVGRILSAAGGDDAEVARSVKACEAWEQGAREQTPPTPAYAAHDKWRRRWRPVSPVEAGAEGMVEAGEGEAARVTS